MNRQVIFIERLMVIFIIIAKAYGQNTQVAVAEKGHSKPFSLELLKKK